MSSAFLPIFFSTLQKRTEQNPNNYVEVKSEQQEHQSAHANIGHTNATLERLTVDGRLDDDGKR